MRNSSAEDSRPATEQGDPAATPPAAAGESTPLDPPVKKKKGKKSKAAESAGPKLVRSTETLFRTTYRGILDLTGIADNKAAIMMSLNGGIISVLMAFSESMRADDILRVAWLLLLLCCALSAVFSVGAAFPRVKSQLVTLEEVREGKKNLLFFGTMDQLTEEEFVSEMVLLTQDPERAYRSMAANVYGLGSGLMRKFMLLRLSYIGFLLGVVSAVGWISIRLILKLFF